MTTPLDKRSGFSGLMSFIEAGHGSEIKPRAVLKVHKSLEKKSGALERQR